ncbi:Hsp20 family protein [Nocardia amamiensis]|uniref:Hsp20 family protein n=1 Tax=Nocardia amamiensis TaxID=404578 RepID=A0ABS0CQX9_9NOCA|nr:Hsp20 family protein [Nocardia amamiensis]MBF6298950.1 Hsp20 family protein [Nocardia amamiensis]
MLMRTDPFRDLERLTQQVFGTVAGPTVLPMDAWREGDQFVVEIDAPGIDRDSLGLEVEGGAVTVRARRPELDVNREVIATERPRGEFSRQLFLGDNVDTEHVRADYRDGVLRLAIPLAEKAKPRKIEIDRGDGHTAIDA